MSPEELLPADHPARRAYAAATAAADEAPDPHVRATVLAAAARAVGASPRASDAPAVGPFARRRWPLSAAALLVVSVLTGLVASQALRDDPDRVLTTAPAASPPTIVDAPSSTATAVTSAPTPPTAAPMRAAKSAPTPTSGGTPTAPKTSGDRHRGSDEIVGKPAPSPRSSEPAESPAVADAAPPAAPPTAPMPATMAAPVAQPQAPMSAPALREKARLSAGEELRRNLAADAASASPSAEAARPAPAPHGRPALQPESPEAWVERIVTLRAGGDDAAADRELDALRRRYPDFTIPLRAFERPASR